MPHEDSIVANFAQLAKERGWSLAQMADHLEPMNPSLAADVRAKHTPERSAAPKGRRSAGKSEGA